MTKKIDENISDHAPMVMMLLVMLISGPSVYDLGKKIFENDPVRQITLLVISEVAVILWHIMRMRARSESQRSTSRTMTWVSIAAVGLLAGTDVLLTVSRSKQLNVTFDEKMIGLILTVVVVAAIIANIVGSLNYKEADPDLALRHEEQNVDFKIKSETMRQLANSTDIIASEVARLKAQDHAMVVRATTKQRLMGGYTNEPTPQMMNAEVPAMARLVASAAPSGPTVAMPQGIDYDQLAAAMLRMQSSGAVQPVTVVAEGGSDPKAK